MRSISLLILVAWLLAILVDALTVAALPAVLIGVAGLAVGYAAWRWGVPAWRRRKRASRHVEIALRPPPERYGMRAPVPLAVLVRALEDADLGEVVRREDRIEVRAGTGAWTIVMVAEPAAVTLASVRVDSSSADHALLCCDALVPRLGPLTFCAEGIELFIDGTLPRVELERQLHDLQIDRVRDLRQSLDAVESGGGPRYLN